MGKHTNNKQEDCMIDFMEKHPQMAKGFVKGNKVEVEKEWQSFAKELNRIGPPLKDCNGWKKIWSDKKSSIKKKIATNKRESQATGGGPYKQLYISSREEAIGKLCGLYDIINGIKDSVSFGFQPVEENTQSTGNNLETITECVSESEDQEDQPISSQANRARKDPSSLQDNMKNFMCTEKETHAEMTKNLQEITNTLKSSLDISKNSESDFKRIYRSLEKVADRIAEQTKATDRQTEEIKNQTEEIQRHNKEMEKLSYEKNIIKKKTLELQKEQIDIYKL